MAGRDRGIGQRKLQGGKAGVTHAEGGSVSQPHVHRDQLRRRAGRAVNRIQATRDDIAAAVGCDPSNISHWRNGLGPIGQVTEIIDAMERAKIDTSSLYTHFRTTALSAKADALADHEVLDGIRVGIADEHTAEAAENDATVRFVATGCYRTFRTGKEGERVVEDRNIAFATVAEMRDLPWRGI